MKKSRVTMCLAFVPEICNRIIDSLFSRYISLGYVLKSKPNEINLACLRAMDRKDQGYDEPVVINLPLEKEFALEVSRCIAAYPAVSFVLYSSVPEAKDSRLQNVLIDARCQEIQQWYSNQIDQFLVCVRHKGHSYSRLIDAALSKH
jgi:hypothetical protein